ncbi:MAG: hypothetical protein PHC69_13235, partial [Ruminiclostridium sp.]|nr:hypothetical protein [Ruminiclostridium sp.]
ISFIEEESLIKKILKHLNLWLDDKQEPPNHSPPQHILDLINTYPDLFLSDPYLIPLISLFSIHNYHITNRSTFNENLPAFSLSAMYTRYLYAAPNQLR